MELYTIITGIALAFAVESFLPISDWDTGDGWIRVLLTVAFLATLIPYYHGALRHLSEAWVLSLSLNARAGDMLCDFVMLFLEAGVLIAVARYSGQPTLFALGVLSLLAMDIGWAFFVTRDAHRGGLSRIAWLSKNLRMFWRNLRCDDPRLIWLAINLHAFPVIATCTWVARANSDAGWTSILILVAVLSRSTFDYYLNRDFYFPGLTQRTRVADATP